MTSTGSVTAQTGKITTLDVDTLKINQGTTNVKWNPAKKHTDIIMLNGTDTAKLSTTKSGVKAILADTSYTVGTDTESLTYKVHQGSVIHVGLAETSRNLSSLAIGSDLISQVFTVSKNTTIDMTLSRTLISTGPDVYSSALKFVHDGKTTTLDASGYNGQTMFPWLSDDSKGSGFSVSISRESVLTMSVRADGGIVFSTLSNGTSRPVIFDTGTDQVIFGNVGFSGVPDITYDIVETSTAVANGSGTFDMTLRVSHPNAPGSSNPSVTIGQDAKITTPLGLSTPYIESPSADLLLRRNGGVDVTISVAGAMVLPSSLTATSIISDTVQPAAGTNLSLLEGSGKGIIVQDVTGDTFISDRLSVGDDGELTSPAVLANFNTVAQDSTIVVPTLPDVTTDTISVQNQVLGMVCYSVADAKFMGFGGAGWVALSP